MNAPKEKEQLQKVPLMLLPRGISSRLSKIFSGVSSQIAKLFPGMKYDLETTDLHLAETEYISFTILNSAFYFIIFFALLFSLLFFVQEEIAKTALLLSAGYSLLIAAIIFYTLLKYPRVLAEKKAEQVDKHLLFALKDLKLQISSGVTLYNAMVNVSKAGYGQVSAEFDKTVRNINTGMPVDKALEKMAVESKSPFLRRMTWQLVNTMKAGASIEGTLGALIRDLTVDQHDKIKKYTAELNLWILVYLLFAVAVPALGTALLIILSSFAGYGVSKGFIIGFICICLFIQIVLIGFITTRRPVVVL